MSLGRGKLPVDFKVLSVRPLKREDLAKLESKRAVSTQGPISRIRDTHHRLARYMASGLKQGEAARAAGFSISRASVLSNDPSFKELVETYRQEIKSNFLETVDEYAETAVSNMLKAERQIAERLEAADDEDGDAIPVNQLIAISRDAADRFGYGKKETRVNVNVDFAAQLERAIKRSSKVIEMGPPTGTHGAPSPVAPKGLLSAGSPSPLPAQDSVAEQPQQIRRRV